MYSVVTQFIPDRPDFDSSFSSIFRKGGRYGAEEVDRIKSMVPVGASILIVGGHIGTLAVPLSRHAGTLTVVEANPNTFRFLAANLAMNGCDNVRAIEMAAGEAPGEIEFVANRANSGGSKRKPKISDPRYYYDRPSVIRVKMNRLDDIVPENFDALVMDIEGSEFFALKGMTRILSGIDKIFVEFIAHHLQNVSGASAREFYGLLAPEFRFLHVPSKGSHFEGDAILPALEKMVAQDCNEEIVVFSRTPFKAEK